MTTEPQTKAQQILDPHSDWNQTPNDEPIYILRAVNWKPVLVLAALVKGDNRAVDAMLETAMKMRDYDRDNDIPF
jgi:hypothetical protein